MIAFLESCHVFFTTLPFSMAVGVIACAVYLFLKERFYMHTGWFFATLGIAIVIYLLPQFRELVLGSNPYDVMAVDVKSTNQLDVIVYAKILGCLFGYFGARWVAKKILDI